jgi:23S rRNA (cytosine1962-C5)-methyltransferase
MASAELHIEGEAGKAVRAGCPFVLREDLTTRTRGLAAGAVVDLSDGRGFAGRGIYDDAGATAVRVFTRDRKVALDGAFWKAGVERAVALRRTLVQLNFTDAWRAVNGAGDGLPGLTVETYSSFAAVRLDSESLRPHLGSILDAVRATLQPRGLYEKRQGPDGGRGHHVGGSTAPDSLPVREGNLRFLVRLGEGEKTGLYLDMRETRRALARLCRGRQVLNAYSFTGAQSLTAAAAGSPRVVSVDPSPRATAWSRETFNANGLPPESHEFLTGDPREVLTRIGASARRFDLVLVDSPLFTAPPPPPVAAKAAAKKGPKPAARKSGKKPPKGKKRRMGAGPALDPVELYRRGYRALVQAAAAVMPGQGLLCCSLHEKDLPYREFLGLLRDAAAEGGFHLQVLEEHGLPGDFPMNPSWPAGRYYRFLVCAVRK